MLEGRKILITNVTHFVGVAASHAMEDMGASVVCHDASFTDAAAREDFTAAHGGLIAIAAQEPGDAAREAVEAAGHIDVLICNDSFPAIRAKVFAVA